MMQYKGYTGVVTSVDEKQRLIHGEVAGINDVVTFEGRNADELARAFRDSIDDYLEFCAEENDPPEKPFSGKFLVRVQPDLHRRAVLAAEREGLSLNRWLAASIKRSVTEATHRGSLKPATRSKLKRQRRPA